MKRLTSLDALRGLIMVVMALDHANAFIAHAHPRPEFWSGPYPAYTDALSFLTRFVTHLAAPGFFFLMGMSMILFADSRRKAGWSERNIILHFVVRGLILVALQFLVENPAWQISEILNGGGSLFPIYMGVLYGLGGAMIFAAQLLRLPFKAIIALGLIALLLPEVLILLAPSLAQSSIAALLVMPAFTETFTVYYPIVPWLGITLLGAAFGQQLLADRDRTCQRALYIGLSLLVAFIVVRALRSFGNIRVIPYIDWIDFLNVVKYPPSLTFVLVTLGLDLTFLSLFSRLGRIVQLLTVFGRSPLFFYIAHLYLYGLIGIFFFPRGSTIPAMYPIWLIGLVILYGLCYVYGKFKDRQAPDSLWRFV